MGATDSSSQLFVQSSAPSIPSIPTHTACPIPTQTLTVPLAKSVTSNTVTAVVVTLAVAALAAASTLTDLSQVIYGGAPDPWPPPPYVKNSGGEGSSYNPSQDGLGNNGELEDDDEDDDDYQYHSEESEGEEEEEGEGEEGEGEEREDDEEENDEAAGNPTSTDGEDPPPPPPNPSAQSDIPDHPRNAPKWTIFQLVYILLELATSVLVIRHIGRTIVALDQRLTEKFVQVKQRASLPLRRTPIPRPPKPLPHTTSLPLTPSSPPAPPPPPPPPPPSLPLSPPSWSPPTSSRQEAILLWLSSLAGLSATTRPPALIFRWVAGLSYQATRALLSPVISSTWTLGAIILLLVVWAWHFAHWWIESFVEDINEDKTFIGEVVGKKFKYIGRGSDSSRWSVRDDSVDFPTRPIPVLLPSPPPPPPLPPLLPPPPSPSPSLSSSPPPPLPPSSFPSLPPLLFSSSSPSPPPFSSPPPPPHQSPSPSPSLLPPPLSPLPPSLSLPPLPPPFSSPSPSPSPAPTVPARDPTPTTPESPTPYQDSIDAASLNAQAGSRSYIQESFHEETNPPGLGVWDHIPTRSRRGGPCDIYDISTPQDGPSHPQDSVDEASLKTQAPSTHDTISVNVDSPYPRSTYPPRTPIFRPSPLRYVFNAADISQVESPSPPQVLVEEASLGVHQSRHQSEPDPNEGNERPVHERPPSRLDFYDEASSEDFQNHPQTPDREERQGQNNREYLPRLYDQVSSKDVESDLGTTRSSYRERKNDSDGYFADFSNEVSSQYADNTREYHREQSQNDDDYPSDLDSELPSEDSGSVSSRPRTPQQEQEEESSEDEVNMERFKPTKTSSPRHLPACRNFYGKSPTRGSNKSTHSSEASRWKQPDDTEEKESDREASRPRPRTDWSRHVPFLQGFHGRSSRDNNGNGAPDGGTPRWGKPREDPRKQASNSTTSRTSSSRPSWSRHIPFLLVSSNEPPNDNNDGAVDGEAEHENQEEDTDEEFELDMSKFLPVKTSSPFRVVARRGIKKKSSGGNGNNAQDGRASHRRQPESTQETMDSRTSVLSSSRTSSPRYPSGTRRLNRNIFEAYQAQSPAPPQDSLDEASMKVLGRESDSLVDLPSIEMIDELPPDLPPSIYRHVGQEGRANQSRWVQPQEAPQTPTSPPRQRRRLTPIQRGVYGALEAPTGPDTPSQAPLDTQREPPRAIPNAQRPRPLFSRVSLPASRASAVASKAQEEAPTQDARPQPQSTRSSSLPGPSRPSSDRGASEKAGNRAAPQKLISKSKIPASVPSAAGPSTIPMRSAIPRGPSTAPHAPPTGAPGPQVPPPANTAVRPPVSNRPEIPRPSGIRYAPSRPTPATTSAIRLSSLRESIVARYPSTVPPQVSPPVPVLANPSVEALRWTSLPSVSSPSLSRILASDQARQLLDGSLPLSEDTDTHGFSILERKRTPPSTHTNSPAKKKEKRTSSTSNSSPSQLQSPATSYLRQRLLDGSLPASEEERSDEWALTEDMKAKWQARMNRPEFKLITASGNSLDLSMDL